MRRDVSFVLLTIALFGLQPAPSWGRSLSGGKIAKFLDQGGTDQDKAIIKFSREPAIAEPLPDASCPHESSIRLVTDRHDIGVVPLGCTLWRPAGNGLKYLDKEGLFGGVQKILVRATPKGGTVLLRLKGDNYGLSAIDGPIDFIEVHLTIGATQYCGRFAAPLSTQRKNDPARVIFKGPSTACVVSGD